MKSDKLKRHFDTKHQNFSDKDVQYFKNKADGVKKGRLDARGRYQQQNVAAVTIQYNSRLLKISKLTKAETAITGYNIAYSDTNQLMFPHRRRSTANT